MKLIKSTIAVLAIASSSLFAAAASSGEFHQGCRSHPGGGWPIDPAEYVVRNCAFCHGVGLQGRFVAPRLAGQHQEYIVYQLERFRNHSRDNPLSLTYMSHAARKVLPDSDCELGAYISSMPAEPMANGNPELAGKGEEIFMHGIPDANVPACQFCHGPEAQGTGKFPRLGGQSYYYLKRRLEQWKEGYSAISPNMPHIASLLTSDEMDAVASYLSFLPEAPSKGEF